MSPALICAAVLLGACVVVAVIGIAADLLAPRRQARAADRVATYVARQEQARQAEALGRHNLAAVLRGHPASDTWVDPAAIAAELEAPDPEPFARTHLDAWPAQVSGTGHPCAVDQHLAHTAGPCSGAHAPVPPGQRPGPGLIPLEVPTAAQPAAIVDRTGVVLELYPPTPRPTPHPRADVVAISYADRLAASMAVHPAGRGRHAATVTALPPAQ